MRIERLLGWSGGSAASRMTGLVILTVGMGSIVSVAQTAAPASTASNAASGDASTSEASAPKTTTAANIPADCGATGVAGAAYGVAGASANPSATNTGPTGPVRVRSGVVAGMMLSKVNPVYPAEARKAGVQGVVIMHAIISKTGTIEDLKVISGPELLQQAAVDAVQRWTYSPYILDCKPVEVETSITVNFTFGGAKPVPPPPPPLEALHQSSEIDMLHEGTPPVVQSAPAESDDAGGAVKKVGGGVSAPVLVKQVEPQFSPEAKQNKIGGPVAVSLIVDEQGMPQKVHVSRGVGNGLDEKAVEAVKQYRFKPAMENGQPVAVYLYVEVNFEVF